MDSDRSLTAPSRKHSRGLCDRTCQRLEPGLATHRMWAELGGLDNPKISVSNGNGVIFFEA